MSKQIESRLNKQLNNWAEATVREWLKRSERNQASRRRFRSITDQLIAEGSFEATRQAPQPAVGEGGGLPDVTKVQQEWWRRCQAEREADRIQFTVGNAIMTGRPDQDNQTGCGWLLLLIYGVLFVLLQWHWGP